MSKNPSDNTQIDAQILPTIKDPKIVTQTLQEEERAAYINQFAKFILPYIQRDYERGMSK